MACIVAAPPGSPPSAGAQVRHSNQRRRLRGQNDDLRGPAAARNRRRVRDRPVDHVAAAVRPQPGKEFTLRSKAGEFGKRILRAVDDVSFDLAPGQVLGLVGESGCGKSTTARCILRLIEPTSGEIFYKGEDLLAKSHKQMRELRKELQVVFQDPYSSLHPRRRIRQTIAEPMIVQECIRRRRWRGFLS